VKGKAPVLILIAAALVLAFGLAACRGSGASGSSSPPAPSASGSPSPAAASQTVKVAAATMPSAVHLKVGDRLKVLLHSNSASSGYVWTAEGMQQAAVLKQLGKPVDIPAKSALVGAPGKTKFTFQAVEKGTEQLGFWYARPSDTGNPGAAYALVVTVGKGHLPVEVTAGEAYTAETAQIRTGDTLQIFIKHASSQGKVSWQPASSTAPVKPVGGQAYSSAGGGTVTMSFVGAGTGAGTLVLVNRPAGGPPLQTYSLPVNVKPVKQPVTIQVNQNDAHETFSTKAGDTVQLTLPAQPSTGYDWVIKGLKSSVLQQVGQPKFTAGSAATGATGKMLWTFRVVGPGKASVRALLEGPDAGSTGPALELDFTVSAKPGYRPKLVQAVDEYPAPTVFIKPGDQIHVTLAASAGTWAPQGTGGPLTHSQPVVSGGKAVVTYTAQSKGIGTEVLVANAAGNAPNQAYAFSAVVGAGKLPETVTAAEQKVAKPLQIATGEMFTVELPGNPDGGYTWVVSPPAVGGVIEQAGDIAFTADSSLMGAPGVFTAQFKGVGAGSVPLVMLYQGPGSAPLVDGIWMTMVNVQ